MRSILSRLLICILTALVLGLVANGQERSARIDVDVRIYRTTDNSIVHKVNLNYELKGIDSVFIEGIGAVPAKGSLLYFTENSEINIKESRDGRLITSISLLGPDVYTSKSLEADFPEDSQFIVYYRSAPWTYKTSFPLVANQVVNRFFPSGINAYQANHIDYIKTTFAPLQGLPAYLVGEIAVLLSHPYNPKLGIFEFHVQFVARERRKQSSGWRYEISQEVKSSSEKFINEIIENLNNKGKKNK